jgi:hypothetical protein
MLSRQIIQFPFPDFSEFILFQWVVTYSPEADDPCTRTHMLQNLPALKLGENQNKLQLQRQ